MMQFFVEHRGLPTNLHIYVDGGTLPESFVQGVELVGLNGLQQLGLVILDLFLNALGPAHRSLFVNAVMVLVDPSRVRTILAEEFVGNLAVVSDVLKVKFRLAGLALFRFRRVRYQFFGRRLRSKL